MANTKQGEDHTLLCSLSTNLPSTVFLNATALFLELSLCTLPSTSTFSLFLFSPVPSPALPLAFVCRANVGRNGVCVARFFLFRASRRERWASRSRVRSPASASETSLPESVEPKSESKTSASSVGGKRGQLGSKAGVAE